MREELVKALVSELTCEICYSLFFDPVTTPCQHTFCSKCLLRALDHSGLCPLCRDELPGYAFHHNHPSNTILDNLIMTLLPEQYEQRKQAYLADESLALGTNGVSVPIFPCALAFPGMPISLNIFEPRYRLMIRRCLENGTHSFGMTMLPNPNTGEEVMYGTMLEMKSVRMLPDGRSAIETVGSYRFKIKERAWMDGYIIARIERVDDYTPEMEAMIDRMPMSSEELVAVCHAFIERMKKRVAPWVIQRMNETYGPVPDDPAKLSFWMALVLPVDDYDKVKLLPLRSPRLRLRLIVHWIEAMESQHWWSNSGCVIM
ncbi:PUA-like domain-containing protein [Cantharellus anzutake]|uniref:PUA-like domain-containing protein n=1 Tax=Cantharellus anzutake TaxID=1750568 RepID=UPI00190618FE|nr:PUA-like domain-containing protein [Cantharellus anzutake]KAF8339058.1 PUA-like domain-containing protein [Cantharellus anzutake]